MAKYLCIFVDSFPFVCLPQAEFLSGLPMTHRVIPGVGYSINLLPELFAGMAPDEIGFFGEWTYGDGRAPYQSIQVGRFLEMLASINYYVDRLMHKSLGRAFGLHLAQIPFDKLPFFYHCGKSIYDPPLVNHALFSLCDPPMTLIRAENYAGNLGSRDKAALSIAHNSLESNLFVSLVDLDGMGHRYGIQSREHNSYIRFLDSEIKQLWESFCAANRHYDPILIVLSDHGMANVRRTIELDLESHFGSPSPNSYVYFLDSTILRVWAKNTGLRNNIGEYLTKNNNGVLLEADERQSYGVTSSFCGDLLYVLNEGLVFLPSFHGLRKPTGMHGYHPEALTQHAIMLSTHQFPRALDFESIQSREIFEMVSKHFEITA